MTSALARISDYLRLRDIDGEVLVLDDGLTRADAERVDDSLRDVRGRRLLQGQDVDHRGPLAAAVHASGRRVLLVDRRLSVPIERHAVLADAARDYDLDLAAGSRSGTSYRPRAGERITTALVSAVLRIPDQDPLCPFLLFDNERVGPLLGRMVAEHTGVAELRFLCHRLRLSTREVGVEPDPTIPPEAPGPAAIPRVLVELATIRWRLRRGLYHPGGGEDTTPR